MARCLWICTLDTGLSPSEVGAFHPPPPEENPACLTWVSSGGFSGDKTEHVLSFPGGAVVRNLLANETQEMRV